LINGDSEKVSCRMTSTSCLSRLLAIIFIMKSKINTLLFISLSAKKKTKQRFRYFLQLEFHLVCVRKISCLLPFQTCWFRRTFVFLLCIFLEVPWVIPHFFLLSVIVSFLF
jgi:hypothetical protein